MASTPVQRQVTPIDPMFPIPEGTDELVYGDASGIDPNRQQTGPVDAYTGSPIDPSFIPEPDTEGQVFVPTPEIVGIVSQQVRRAPDGTNVIDVVIEVSDVVGATNYEFRVTKI